MKREEVPRKERDWTHHHASLSPGVARPCWREGAPGRTTARVMSERFRHYTRGRPLHELLLRTYHRTCSCTMFGMNPVRDAAKWYVYLLQSDKDSHWYTGFTNDLRKRFKEHVSGLVRSTKGRGPLKLIYYEMCLNQYDARSRELFLKSGMGKRYLQNRLKRFLSLTG
jgi:putative endonuclease